MSGSFWKFSNGFSSVSNISTILENYNINQDAGDLDATPKKVLAKLFDESDLLQELLANNSVLLEFLRDDEVLSILFDLVINEGPLVEAVTKDLENLEIADSPETRDDGTDPHDAESNGDAAEDESSQDTSETGGDDDASDDDETDEEKHTRHATLATEILSADVWSLTDTVMESTANLNRLWSILDSHDPLSINLSTFFMKIMEHLLDMKCDEMITYLIENQPNLVEKFMNHLTNPPLMDFLLKLISTDKPDNSTGIIDFLQNQNLISRLIEALDPDSDGPQDIALIRQSSAADLLKALITISANSTTDNSTIGPNELTRELVSYESMGKLCTIMLKGGYALANGVGIVIEIIRKNNSDYDILPILYITLESHPPTGRDPIYLGHLLRMFSERISDFKELLASNRESNVSPTTLKTPFGEIEPLGFERFKICELIAELLHCSNMALLNDNKGFDVVKERDELRNKMKEFDPISFKYNEVILLPDTDDNESKTLSQTTSTDGENEDFNDTIDSFNSRSDNEYSVLHNRGFDQGEDELHENANLSEEQLRSNPVIGDVWKIALNDTQIISNILSMFFKFPWNNFLHNVVFDIVQQVLNGSMDIGFNKFLAIDLFDNGDITNRIIEGQNLCNEYEAEHNGMRLGYMGHLTLIAEEVVKFIQSYPANALDETIDRKISEPAWEDYVNNILYDTREKYNAILGGGDEDDDEEEEATNTFDEGAGEVIDESDYRSGFLFENEPVDAETKHVDDEEDDEEEDIDEESSRFGKKASDSHKSLSDESESEDDDDHFTKYMSQELVNTASTEVAISEDKNSDEEELSSDDEVVAVLNEKTDDIDEYEDPNDDGLSYKKFNPLYDDSGSLISDVQDTADLSSEDSSDSSDDEEGEYDIGADNQTTKLTRAASKG